MPKPFAGFTFPAMIAPFCMGPPYFPSNPWDIVMNSPVPWLRVATKYMSEPLVFEAKVVPFLELSICMTLTVPRPVALSALLTMNLLSNTADAERYLGQALVGIWPTALYIVVPPPAWTPPFEVIDAPPTLDVVAAAETVE